MKKLIFILLLLCNTGAFSQSLTLFDVDTTDFPIIRAKFYAFDAAGNQILGLSPSDFTLRENGSQREIISVSCPKPKEPLAVSVAMSIDVSGSMAYSGYNEIPVELGKTTAKELCNIVVMPPSEFALQTCHHKALIIQDFTSNREKIISSINPIKAGGNNNFVEHLLNGLTGLLNIAKTGKNKRVAVLYTDAWWYALKSLEIQQCKDICSKYNIQFYPIIYSRPEAEPNGIKKSLQELADVTGGYLFDGITSIQAAKEIGKIIQKTWQDEDPCEIEWESGISCTAGNTNVKLTLLQNGSTATTSYQSPNDAVARLEIDPVSIKILKPEVGVQKDTTITITAMNADFTVTNITSSNAAFMVTPTSFSLSAGQSRDLTISYIPADSGYTFTIFEFETDICPRKYYASGGWPGKRPTVKTIKLIHPNGGEVFVAGSDTVITWEGVLPVEPVNIEYSTNKGEDWITIADTASGLSYNWHVPNTPSDNCLARITAKAQTQYYCDNPDVQLCNQIWMGCNLDVEYYRNGEPIRHCETAAEWEEAGSKKEGAWCYYNNNDSLGQIYGKLYNWYAVNDPRGLAPEGWHVPTDEEWKELEMCLGMSHSEVDKMGTRGSDQGSQLAGRSELWQDADLENNAAFGSSGFSALPGGHRIDNGTFYFIGGYGYWWSSSEYISTHAWHRYLYYDYSKVIRLYYVKNYGFSVRCVRD